MCMYERFECSTQIVGAYVYLLASETGDIVYLLKLLILAC